jgi:hypothetical protein
MTANQIADAIINEVQPTQPTTLDILNGTVERHTFTAKTANLSLEQAICRRCGDNSTLCNEVYEIIKKRFENED